MHYNLGPCWGFEPRAVSPYKAIPAGGRVSCSPFSACLYSRPEERCSADCPYFGLTLWYLGISSHRFCFYVFNFCFLLFFDASNKPLNRSQTRRPDPFRLSAVTTRGLCLYSSGDCSFLAVHKKMKKKSGVNNHKDSNLRPWNFAICSISCAEEEEIWVEWRDRLLVNSCEDSNLRLCNIGIKCSTSWAEENLWVNLCMKLHAKSVKWKMLVDYDEDFNLKSTDFAVRYCICWSM